MFLVKQHEGNSAGMIMRIKEGKNHDVSFPKRIVILNCLIDSSGSTILLAYLGPKLITIMKSLVNLCD